MPLDIFIPAAVDARDFEIHFILPYDPYYTKTCTYRPPYGPLLPPWLADDSKPDGALVESRRTVNEPHPFSAIDSSRDFHVVTLTADRRLNFHLLTYRPPYGPLLPDSLRTDKDAGAVLIEERSMSSDRSAILRAFEWEYGLEFDTSDDSADGHVIGDSEDESEAGFDDDGVDLYYEGDSERYYGSESDLVDAEDADCAEKEEEKEEACGLRCGREVGIQFEGCRHTICVPCCKQLWWSRQRRGKTYPRWIPCPFCRFKVRKVGVLSRQPLAYGFGEEVVTSVGLNVWEWKPVRRWMLNESKKAEHAIYLYYHYSLIFMKIRMNKHDFDND